MKKQLIQEVIVLTCVYVSAKIYFPHCLANQSILVAMAQKVKLTTPLSSFLGSNPSANCLHALIITAWIHSRFIQSNGRNMKHKSGLM